MDGEHIGLIDGLRIDALVRLHIGERGEAVAVSSGGLEIEALRCRGHVLLDFAADRLTATGEEIVRLLHQLCVVLKGNHTGARRRAPLDLVEQARTGAALEDGIRARTQKEGALQCVDRARHRAGRRERSEVTALTRARPAMLGKLRGGVIAGDHDVGERLVVAKQHVVARTKALDKVGLKQQRFGLGAGRDELHRRRRLDDAVDAAGLTRRSGIAGHTLLQASRFADVKHDALRIDHPVDAGPVRQPLDDVGDNLRSDLRRRGWDVW